LKTELLIKRIAQAVSRGEEGKEAAMILIEQAIPCILHLENRVAEKIIMMLLSLEVELYQQKAASKA
jgi:hypothetical protein